MSKYITKYFALRSIFGLIAVLAFFLVLAQVVMACSPIQQMVTIEAQVDQSLLSQQRSCLDQNCLFVLEKDQFGFFSLKSTNPGEAISSREGIGSISREGNMVMIYFPFYQNDTLLFDEVAFMDALDRLVENDISDIKPTLFQEIKNLTKGREGYFLSNNLIFTPYEQSKESELLKEKNQLLDCHYAEYTRVGNWLVKNPTDRDYCYFVEGVGGMCPSAFISYPQFLAFLLSDINETTVPYLAVLVLLIGGIVIFGINLMRKKELWFFLKPKKGKIIVTTIAGAWLFLAFLSGILGIERFLGYLLVVYLIVSVIGYSKLPSIFSRR